MAQIKTAPEGEQLEVMAGSERIGFRLRRSSRGTLAITVKPDTAVVVTAPAGADVEAVKAKVRKRANWIRQQRRFFERYLPPVPPRRYVSGETHRYFGRQYRLKISEGPGETVKLKGQFIYVETARQVEHDRVRNLVEAWYVEHARMAFARSLTACLPRLHGRVSEPPRLHLRRMPKRWGSWTRRGAIYLNPELVRAPGTCIDYVVTHELCHLVHGHHGREFFALLRRSMPDWETRKARLERSMGG
ncbi:MAG: SprT family zinc-dependent metalloprotease [Verrucomicrobiota bacterium]